MSNRFQLRKSRAFTLVELLVVIGIIALLIAILLPVLSKARAVANDAKCQSNIRQLTQAFLMYADANNGFFPCEGDDGTTSAPVTQTAGALGTTLKLTWDSSTLWWNAIPSYLSYNTYYQMQTQYMSGIKSALPGMGASSVFICPALYNVGPATQDTSGGITVTGGFFRLHGAPAGSGGSGTQVLPTCMCYAMNSKLNATVCPPKLSVFPFSSVTALVVEKRMSPGEISKTDPNYSTDFKKNLGQLKCDFDRVTLRHRSNTGGFIGYCDGHVDFVLYDQINKPRAGGDYNLPGLVIWDPYAPLLKD